MNEWIDLFTRSIVTGMGTGVGSYLVLRVMIQHLDKRGAESLQPSAKRSGGKKNGKFNGRTRI